jgi:hypothetical protein
LIEELMIATNGCTARFLAARGSASLRRVVRSTERWLRIVAVAQEYGEALPTEPDSLSLIVVKLMGRGEYVVETAGAEPAFPGPHHFAPAQVPVAGVASGSALRRHCHGCLQQWRLGSRLCATH